MRKEACQVRVGSIATMHSPVSRERSPLWPQIEGRTSDLARFNLAIDSKLRGCHVLAIRIEDVAAGGYTADRAMVRQKKTGRPVRFELSEQTRQAVGSGRFVQSH